MTFRPLHALRQIDEELNELSAADKAAEEWSRFELARSASRFSVRTKKVVDDTMALSATLMRAGEVEEATRLMAEAEAEVATEKAALQETVEEARLQGAMRRERMTRLRLLKLLATTLLGAGLFVSSAFGVVLARYFTGNAEARNRVATVASRAVYRTERGRVLRSIEVVPGLHVRLSGSQLRHLNDLTGDSSKKGELKRFLLGILPPELADHVQSVLTGAEQTIATTVAEVEGTIQLERRTTDGRSPQKEAESDEGEQDHETASSSRPKKQDGASGSEGSGDQSPAADDGDGKDSNTNTGEGDGVLGDGGPIGGLDPAGHDG